MHPSTYRNFSAAEETHWWFRHRRAMCRVLLGRTVGREAARTALDLGCGTGGNLPLLGEFARTVVGVDLSDQALAICREKGREAALVRGDATAVDRTFAPDSIELAALFNVLYHSWIEDDDAVLRSVFRIVRPGGRVLVYEAAFDSLRRRRDRFDYGARRYRLGPLKRQLEQAGFSVERATYTNLIGFPLAWFLARLDRLSGNAEREPTAEEVDHDLTAGGGLLHSLAYAVTGLERAWLRAGARLPFGINLMMVARKPDGQVGT